MNILCLHVGFSRPCDRGTTKRAQTLRRQVKVNMILSQNSILKNVDNKPIFWVFKSPVINIIALKNTLKLVITLFRRRGLGRRLNSNIQSTPEAKTEISWSFLLKRHSNFAIQTPPDAKPSFSLPSSFPPLLVLLILAQ